jgi:ferric-dicitrate binding protein FerR (iron transport regulator)
MSEPRDWDILAKYLANEASAEEIREIQVWINSDPDNRLMVERLRASFAISPVQEEASDLNAMWSRIAAEVGRSKYGITRERPRRSWLESMKQALSLRPGWSFRPVLMTALAMAVVVALVWYPYQAYWGGPEMMFVRAPLGQTVNVELHDGSRVVLDAGSELRHPAEFTNGSREVTLTGQGYFQIARDEFRPFRVTAGRGTVEVLGTAFEITCWHHSSTVVTVKEGRVRFRRSESPIQESVVLTDNQMSQIYADGSPSSPAGVDASRRLAWLRDEVYFDDVPLIEVLDRLHRWHDVRVLVSEDGVLDERVTIHLVKSDLQGSLDLIGQIIGMDAMSEDGVYEFVRRGSGSN